MARPACDCCEKVIAYDLIVPDDLWAQIAPKPVEGWKGGGLLCPDCILSRALAAAEQRGREEAAKIVEGYGLMHALGQSLAAAIRRGEP